MASFQVHCLSECGRNALRAMLFCGGRCEISCTWLTLRVFALRGSARHACSGLCAQLHRSQTDFRSSRRRLHVEHFDDRLVVQNTFWEVSSISGDSDRRRHKFSKLCQVTILASASGLHAWGEDLPFLWCRRPRLAARPSSGVTSEQCACSGRGESPP